MTALRYRDYVTLIVRAPADLGLHRSGATRRRISVSFVLRIVFTVSATVPL